MAQPQNKFFIQPDWGFFAGQFSDNLSHQHLAVQLTISIQQEFEVNSAFAETSTFNTCLIQSNVPHQLTTRHPVLLFLFNPFSSMGHRLKQLGGAPISPFVHQLATQFKELGMAWERKNLTFEELVQEIQKELHEFKCQCVGHDHWEDERITRIIEHLSNNADRQVPLEEAAGLCHLSPDRFLHLFKEKTGLTFRKVQQWNRLKGAFQLLNVQSLTQTAHEMGFSDSAHFSRNFKQTFGFSPRNLLQQ